MSVIPDTSLGHSVALFRQRENCSDQFLAALQKRCPGVEVDDDQWTSVSTPRPVAYGPVQWNEWKWRVIMDLEGLVPEIRTMLADAARHEAVKQQVLAHQMGALVYLLEAPSDSSPLERLRMTCQLPWAYMEAGASLVGFPEGRTIWTSSHLATLQPEELDAECVHAFVSSDFSGSAEGDRYWFRTWGMHHFGLADLACTVSAEEEMRYEVAAAELLMRMAPSYLVSLGSNIQSGQTLEVHDWLWRITDSAPTDPTLVSPYGIQLYTLERVPAAV